MPPDRGKIHIHTDESVERPLHGLRVIEFEGIGPGPLAGPGDDMATISETDVVVLVFIIGMPEIDHRSAKRAAASRQHKARKFKGAASSARLAQVTALRRLGYAHEQFIEIDSSASMPMVSRNRRLT